MAETERSSHCFRTGLQLVHFGVGGGEASVGRTMSFFEQLSRCVGVQFSGLREPRIDVRERDPAREFTDTNPRERWLQLHDYAQKFER